MPEGDWRCNYLHFQGDNFHKNLDLARRVQEIVREKDTTSAQIALAWLLAQGEDIAPIPGTKQRKYLEQNVAALNVRLDEANLQRIDAAFPRGITAGNRCADMSIVNY